MKAKNIFVSATIVALFGAIGCAGKATTTQETKTEKACACAHDKAGQCEMKKSGAECTCAACNAK
jgi:hypothetical protein